MRLDEGEPYCAPWRTQPLAEFVTELLARVGTTGVDGGPPVVAIDGRSSSGKTTLTGRLAAAIPGSAVVHTDDIAWWHSPFGWADLLVDHVIATVSRGEPVAYRPPGWVERDRPGAVEVPARPTILLVEGIGSGRRALTEHLDAVVFVQSDLDVRNAREEVRVAAGEITPSNEARWMAEELPFVVAERAWERAWRVVAGTPDLTGEPFDPAGDVVVSTSYSS